MVLGTARGNLGFAKTGAGGSMVIPCGEKGRNGTGVGGKNQERRISSTTLRTLVETSQKGFD